MSSDSTENSPEKVAPLSPSSRAITIFLLTVIALQIIVSLVTFPLLPARVPIHWNAAGQVDGYASKWFSLIFYPLMSIGIVVLIRGLMAISPTLDKQGQRANLKFANIVIAGVVLLFLILQLAATAIALHMPIDMTFVIDLAVALLFIVMGNFMGKIRRNLSGVGIRNPWTLANDTVWERTHRLGGWLFVAVGLLNVVLSFIPNVRFFGVLGGVLLIVIVTTIYSYVVYQRVVTHGNEPLSPPFNQGE
ncbi:MAG TPA: DUF1648 domain-containing protein [Ktedonobacteraceae bacterium]|nr:DUF1648 domain-containing protein [Ktedonobacteraceae bacterium]